MRRAPLLVALLLAALPLAGCLDAGPVHPAAAPAPTDPRVATLSAGEAARWDGTELAAPDDGARHGGTACWVGLPCAPPRVACSDASCERIPFRVDVPQGHWEAHDGFLEVSVRWPAWTGQRLALRVEDPAGKLVAWGRNDFFAATGLVAVVERPAPGDYVAVVAALRGAGTYQGVVEVESRPRATGSARELLPDLVTLPPADLTLETPAFLSAGFFPAPGHPLVAEAAEAAGVKGCRLDEAAEYGARRCLRFTNAVGNVGEGPLEIRLPLPGAAPQGAFVQVVHAEDGATREAPAGRAEWHATHAHWHNAAATRFTVHPYDPATGTRGEAVDEGRKTGICFGDVGLVDLGLPRTAPARWSGWTCVDPREARAWTMGIAPNWYDAYPYLLPDQYVDVTGLPDGTYQLCSVVNEDGVLLEADASNNAACAAFRLAGDAVEALDPPPWYAQRREGSTT